MAQPRNQSQAFSSRRSTLPTSAAILIVVFVTVMARLMRIGGLPATDEGIYAYFAQVIYASLSAGSCLPDTGSLALYPMLLSWVFAFDVNHLVALRLMDMLVAVAASYALFRVIEVESDSRLGALLISLLFVFTMNQPLFIQHGFKNSIFAAYVPLFTALYLGLTAPGSTSARRWITIGALLSVSVLLRETLIPFIAVGAISVLIQRGFRSFFQLAFGGIVAGLLIAVSVIAARGGIASLLKSYHDAAKFYASMSDQITALFFDSGIAFVRQARIALVIACFGFLVTLARSLGKSGITSLPKLGFWLAVTLVPLVEPASKTGFPYHFAVCLPGLAGLAALGWRNVCNGRQCSLRSCLACVAVSIAAFSVAAPALQTFRGNWPQSRDVLASFQSAHWPSVFADRSNYLMAAEAIRQAAPPGGTLAISGSMTVLYPLTGLLPPKPELTNLTFAIIDLDFSEPRLRETILHCPPDVVIITSRTDLPGRSEILAAVRNTGIYEQIAEIPTSNYRDYGQVGGLVFRSIKQLPCRDW